MSNGYTTITLNDIAKECEVSASTVSLALREHPRIPEQTRQRITERARDLGYRPNRVAQNLRHSATRTIGCVLPSAMQLHQAILLDHLYERAFKSGYHLQISFTRDDPVEEAKAIDHCLETQCEGIIIVPCTGGMGDIPNTHPIHEIVARDYPCIAVSRGWPMPNVNHDAKQDIGLTTKHLLETGVRNLRLLVVGPDGENKMLGVEVRKAAFEAALRKNGVEPNPNWIFHQQSTFSSIEGRNDDNGATRGRIYDYNHNVEVGARLASAAIDEFHNPVGRASRPPSKKSLGLICSDDQLASGVLLVCRQRGLRVPEDVAITGSGDGLGPHLDLTSVRWDYAQLASTIVSRLQRCIADKTGKQATDDLTEIPGKLIVRGSTRAV